jgi:putative ABC transport system permease protein
MLGKEAQIGRYDSSIQAVIVGVCKDYHVESLTKKIGPVEHVLPINGYLAGFLLKVRPGDVPRTLAALSNEWKTITQYPLDYTFLDQEVADMYKSEARWERTITYSCLFALFIACLGLFCLSAINAANRTREIGIRKVLGATVMNIVGSLSSQFLVLVLLSVLIAVPVSTWIMERWLEDFAYQVGIQWWTFALIGAVAIATALVTVGFQSIRAALANPVNAVRNE